MAKLKLNSALTQLRGEIDGLVIRHTPHGAILSRRPDMSRVKWSPAQKARRKLMQSAAVHYHAVMKDPRSSRSLPCQRGADENPGIIAGDG